MDKPYEDTKWDDPYHQSIFGPGSADMARRRAAHDATGQPLPDAEPGLGLDPMAEKGAVPADTWQVTDKPSERS